MKNSGKVVEMQEDKLNIYNGSFLDEGFDNHMKMLGVEKFDVVVMNPPYQELKPGFKKSQALWDKFVLKVLNTSLIEDGYLVAIHPSGWRNVDGMFKGIQRLMRTKQILYLEMHSQADGVKTFGAETKYDFYCLKNSENKNTFSKIKCENGSTERALISNMEFIPNSNFKLVNSILAKSNEEKVEIISNSSYHTQRAHLMPNCNNEFKYPCVYSVMKKNTRYFYSNTNQKGHFGTPKVIWGKGRVISVGSIIDENGEYGLTQFAFGIVDEPKNLQFIKKAFDSSKFRKLMEDCNIGEMIINRKLISTFRKDFWVDFLD